MIETRRLPFHLPSPLSAVLAVILLVLLTAAIGRPGAQAPASAAAGAAVGIGPVVAIGGGPRPPEMMEEIVRLGGGADSDFVVLPMASAEPLETGAYQKRQLEAAGAGRVRVVHVDRVAADAPDAGELVAGATGFFFSGGDQRRLADVLEGTRLLAAIHRRHRAGAVVAGTSAGAAVMSPLMITGDENLPHPTDADEPPEHDPFSTLAGGVVDVRPGFGFLPGTVVDQHFVARRRHNRLLSLVLEYPDLLGLGVDESTAVVAEARAGGDGAPCYRLRVAGAGPVVVYDASGARPLPPPTEPGNRALRPLGEPLAAADVRLHVLRAGHALDLCRGEVTP